MAFTLFDTPGILAVLTTVLCLIGNLEQVKRNRERRSTLGLSLFEAESRFLGRIPWILYAGCLAQTDWILILNTLVGLVLPGCLLIQFLLYESRTNCSAPILRVTGQFLILVAALICLSHRELLVANRSLLLILPIPATLFLLALGNCSQLRLCEKANDVSAIALSRYSMFIASNSLWLVYAVGKLFKHGSFDSFTLIVTSSFGLIINAVMLLRLQQLRTHSLASSCP